MIPTLEALVLAAIGGVTPTTFAERMALQRRVITAIAARLALDLLTATEIVAPVFGRHVPHTR